MKKENVTISFESEQLAALEFSLKKKNTSVQAQLEELLEARAKARSERNWAESDRRRDAIAALGYTVKDTKQGFEWSLKK